MSLTFDLNQTCDIIKINSANNTNLDSIKMWSEWRAGRNIETQLPQHWRVFDKDITAKCYNGQRAVSYLFVLYLCQVLIC